MNETPEPAVLGDRFGSYGLESPTPFGPCGSCRIYHVLNRPCPRDGAA